MDNLLAYRDLKNNCWWQKTNNGDFRCFPFGHYIFSALNTCSAILQNRDKFVELEYFWRSHVENRKYDAAQGWLDDDGNLSKEMIGKFYDENILNNKKISIYQPEYQLLIEYVKNLTGFRKSDSSIQSRLSIYNNFKFFFTSISSDIFQYEPDIKKRNQYFDDHFDDLIIYGGFELIGNEKPFPVEKFEFTEMCNIFILDFWEFLFNPIFEKTKVLICPNCGCVFPSSNVRAKFCDACKQPEVMNKIRYQKRISNQPRKLHQNILTLAYKLNTESQKESDKFLAESNYYWNYINGRHTEKIKGYLSNIKTENDYVEWLKSKQKEIKERIKRTHTPVS